MIERRYWHSLYHHLHSAQAYGANTVGKLVAATARIAAGEFESEIPSYLVTRLNLADKFNVMTEKLTANHREMRRARRVSEYL